MELGTAGHNKTRPKGSAKNSRSISNRSFISEWTCAGFISVHGKKVEDSKSERERKQKNRFLANASRILKSICPKNQRARSGNYLRIRTLALSHFRVSQHAIHSRLESTSGEMRLPIAGGAAGVESAERPEEKEREDDLAHSSSKIARAGFPVAE